MEYFCFICDKNLERTVRSNGRLAKPAKYCSNECRMKDSKKCKFCKEIKLCSDFKIKEIRKNGIITLEVQSRCKDCFKDYQKEKYQQDPNRSRSNAFRIKYGISLNEYKRMYNEQKGVCGICKKPESRKPTNSKIIQILSVDHCHKSGNVRGLLCHSCNLLLGHAKDDINILENSIDYLSRYQN